MKHSRFFSALSDLEQSLILNCAIQGLRDELEDQFMREGDMLPGVTEGQLVSIHNKLDRYLEVYDVRTKTHKER